MKKIEIIGYLAADAEVKEYNGRYFLSMRVAVSEREKVGDHYENKTTWMNVSRKMVNNESRGISFLQKGARVFVRGNLSIKSYTDKNGVQQIGINIYATEIDVLTYAKKEQKIMSEHSMTNTPEEDCFPF